MKKYICIKDLQYGDFAVGNIATIEEWRETALAWAWNDDNEELQETLEELKQENIIDFIQEIWQIEIVKLNEDFEKLIKELEKESKYKYNRLSKAIENDKEIFENCTYLEGFSQGFKTAIETIKQNAHLFLN